ncbi:MAG: hypothetical protein PWQ28_223 [Candidatus Woesearchaeota archaeon]|nr:hypothetical protein [Candidatus Woesearchaeota archaeon]MDK2907550.1 hypothetical protein [Candidatus Woesearchaeota archaeon]
MAVLGLNITKMYIEKKGKIEKGAQVNTNINLLTVKESKIKSEPMDRIGAVMSFEAKVEYSPDIAEIVISGDLVFSDKDEKVVTDAISRWEKEKKLPTDISIEVYNAILRRVNIEALILADRMRLPPPFKMPRFKKSEA